jgi:hypothetical protein
VDEDEDTRARYLASFVPKDLFREEGKVCLAREVLARYGHREEVRQGFSANFFAGGWTGPTSLHLQKQKENLLHFREGESQENVLRWVDEYISSLDRQIEREKIREEWEGI